MGGLLDEESSTLSAGIPPDCTKLNRRYIYEPIEYRPVKAGQGGIPGLAVLPRVRLSEVVLDSKLIEIKESLRSSRKDVRGNRFCASPSGRGNRL
jgi:hypothetical protein